MLKRMVSGILFGLFMFLNAPTSHAFLSEAADLAITAAGGELQEDDKKLENEILANLSSEAEKEKLKNYIIKTRPIIKEKRKTIENKIFPFISIVATKSTFVSDILMNTLVKGYRLMYEKTLSDEADDSIAIKKFVELREHNIEAGEELFEIVYDVAIKPRDKDESELSLVSAGGMIIAKASLSYNRAASSAAAIATIMESIGMPMEDVDTADIYGYSTKMNPSEPSDGSPTTTPSQTKSKNTPSQTTNTSPSKKDDKSLGNVSLGDDFANIRDQLGASIKPDKIADSGEIYHYYKSMDVVCDGNRIVGLVTDSKNIKTPRGVHTGSTLDEVIDTYGKDYYKTDYEDTILYEYKYSDSTNKPYMLRFAITPSDNSVTYISIRYLDE